VLRPRAFRAAAVARPAGPAPMIMTSHELAKATPPRHVYQTANPRDMTDSIAVRPSWVCGFAAKRCRAVSRSVTSSLDAMPSDTIASAEASSVDQANVFSSFSITFRDTRESWEEFVKNILPVVRAMSRVSRNGTTPSSQTR
jgi:hypothetical protein